MFVVVLLYFFVVVGQGFVVVVCCVFYGVFDVGYVIDGVFFSYCELDVVVCYDDFFFDLYMN